MALVALPSLLLGSVFLLGNILSRGPATRGTVSHILMCRVDADIVCMCLVVCLGVDVVFTPITSSGAASENVSRSTSSVTSVLLGSVFSLRLFVGRFVASKCVVVAAVYIVAASSGVGTIAVDVMASAGVAAAYVAASSRVVATASA